MENADSSPNTNPPQLQTHNEADMRFPQMLTETTETVKSPVDKCDELENSKGTDAEKRANGNEVTVENHLLRATTVGSEENKGSAERPPSPPRQPPYHQTKPSNESDELKLRVNDLDRELETLRNNVDRRRSGNAKKATASAATDGPSSLSHLHSGYVEKILSRPTVCMFHAMGTCNMQQACFFSHKPADYAATYLAITQKHRTTESVGGRPQRPCLPYMVHGHCNHDNGRRSTAYSHDAANALTICELYFQNHTSLPLPAWLELLRREKPVMTSNYHEQPVEKGSDGSSNNGKRKHSPVCERYAKKRASSVDREADQGKEGC